ncbi:hypothetical protein [Lentzea albidocapillata]|uniref:Uncharacterized protein n=1 Tax=Lentzea albidocapillata TaxID=40571 RepID=A0A1W2EP58_9PSEU|nr:hypothetical protein [Lentzea albidocapillata]SMD11322.1 hypothetical protein SAMN05660733_04250 [Lentzea albidocapillata]
MQNSRREFAWLWGPVALVLLALFNVSDYALLSKRGAHFGVSKYSVATLGLPALAVIAGVCLTRHRQWLLVLGSAGVLVASVESQVHFFSLRPGTSGIIDWLGVAGAVLIVIGVLAVTRDGRSTVACPAHQPLPRRGPRGRLRSVGAQPWLNVPNPGCSTRAPTSTSVFWTRPNCRRYLNSPRHDG